MWCGTLNRTKICRPEGVASVKFGMMDGFPRRRAQIAFFAADGEALPKFQTTERLCENGVRGDAVTVFPDVTTRHRLKAVELHEPPECWQAARRRAIRRDGAPALLFLRQARRGRPRASPDSR